jgi:hypothetical protein
VRAEASAQQTRLVRLTVRIPPFHGGDAGSNPARVILDSRKSLGMKGSGRPRVSGTRASWFDSSHPDCRSVEQTLGGPTEARRSDKAKTVVRLHPERLFVPFLARDKVSRITRLKQSHDRLRGRGVTAARQTFNLRGVGSNPSGPTWTCIRDQGVSGSMPGS